MAQRPQSNVNIRPKQSATSPTSPSTGNEPIPPQQARGFTAGTPGFPANSPRRLRTRHACDRCRAMRSKCTGEPRCTKCVKDDAVCVYSDRRRELLKKQGVHRVDRLKVLEANNSILLSALKSVTSSPTFQPSQNPEVMEALQKISDDPTGSNIVKSPESQQVSTHVSSHEEDMEMSIAGDSAGDSAGERETMSAVGSPGGQSEMQFAVDLDYGAGLTGYIGKTSEVYWFQRIREYLVDQSALFEDIPTFTNMEYPQLQVNDLAYFTDSDDLLAVDEDYVESYVCPPSPVAVILTESYFHALQGAFQFVLRQDIADILTLANALPQQPTWAQRRYLGLANMIWAVGARWLQETGLEPPSAVEGHLMYYARARSLGLDHRIQFHHPDIDMIQAMSVLAFYLLINGSIQRAWSILGQAIRHATALGLHIKMGTGAVGGWESHRRASIWHSLYRMEVFLSELMGRPTSIRTTSVTVQYTPLEGPGSPEPGKIVAGFESVISAANAYRHWLNYYIQRAGWAIETPLGSIPWATFVWEGCKVPAKHFSFSLALSHISDNIGTLLYSSPMNKSWSDAQRIIHSLGAELDDWKGNLPKELRFADAEQSGSYYRSKLELALYHCSVSMILYRPCLCVVKIEGESASSEEFNLASARKCVQAAQQMLDLMPDNSKQPYILHVLPWWTYLHYLCQAASILLLELCMGLRHMPDEEMAVFEGIRKTLGYLKSLAEGSKSANKAFMILQPLAEKVLRRYQGGYS